MVRINKTVKKELFRTIRINIKRYVSLVVMILLGVGFYVGMKSSSPSLEKTMISFYDDVKYMDLMFASEIGITEDEINKIKEQIPEIDIVEGGYYEDVLVNFTDQETHESHDYVTAVHSYNSQKLLNRLKLREGRYPQKSNECIADASLYRLDYDIGDTITVDASFFKEKELTITGFSRSPSYISVEKGSSALLSGKIQYFVYVNEDNYDTEQEAKTYSVVYARLKEKYKPFTEKYNQYVDNVAKKVEDLSLNISAKRREDVIKEKTEELNEAEVKYNEEKEKATIELEQAKEEITKAESEIEKAESEIMSDEEVDMFLSLSQTKLDAAASEIKLLKSLLEVANFDGGLGQGNSSNKQENQEYINSLQKKYDEALKAYNKGLSDYKYAKAHLKEEMQTARELLNTRKEEFNNVKEEYNQKEKEVITNLEKTNNELIEAKKDIKKLESKKWSVFTRQDQYGYNSYSSDIYRIKGISRLFPIAFFLVAALVTSSTVSRLVQEERTKIGLFKSLGYGNEWIIYKYVFYAASAAVIGIVLGIIIGIRVFPSVFEEIYSLLYFLPDLKIKISIIHVLIAIIFALLSTIFVVRLTIKEPLNERPYMLMMPKFDEYKQKIFLEKKENYWNKLPLMKKMTFRNLFSKPKRSLMAIVGIAGCTSLIIAGFGSRDSIADAITIQFNKIMDVSAQFYYKSELTDYEMKEEKERIDNLDEVDKSLIARQETVTVKSKNKIYNVYSIIPDDSSKINEMVKFDNVQGKESLDLSSEGVIITEKIAKLANLSAGSYLTYYDGFDIEHKVKIAGVTENYVNDYMYMTKELYKETNDVDSINNSLFVKFKENVDSDKAIELINQNDSFSNYRSLGSVRNTYNNIMEKFAKIIVVITISAGILAFIVLYNLSKINISERLGEIATLKVLGYTPKEVNRFINSEMKILTVVGIILGIVGGYFLTDMILTTCEVDEIMYYHGISYVSYIYSIIITIIFARIINIFIKDDLSKIKMVESLKIRE